MKKLRILLILVLVATSTTNLIGQELRVEPPFWYANMPTEKLQIMLYEENIADRRVSINHSGITLINQIVGDSKNYLFVNLEINPDVKPDLFNIE